MIIVGDILVKEFILEENVGIRKNSFSKIEIKVIFLRICF